MSRLCRETLKLLENRPRPTTYDIIAAKTGVNKRWIEALVAGRIAEPGVQKIEKLYEFLKGEPLKV